MDHTLELYALVSKFTALLENIEELNLQQSQEGVYVKKFIIKAAKAIDKMCRWCIARDFYRLSTPALFDDHDTPTCDYFAQYITKSILQILELCTDGNILQKDSMK